MTSSPTYVAPVNPTRHFADTKFVVRLVLMVFGTFGALTISSVLSVIWILTTTIPSGLEDIGILAAALLLLLSPVLVFAVSSNWAYAASSRATKVLSRLVWGFSLVQLACLGGVVALGLTTGPPLWVVIALVTCGIVFAPVGIVLGRQLRSTPREGAVEVAPLVGWTPPGAGKRDIVPYVAVGVFVVIAVVAVLVARPWEISQLRPREAPLATSMFLLALDVGVLGAMAACAVRVISTSAAVRAVASGNYEQARRIRRAVYRGRTDELEPVDAERARAVAVVSVTMLRWQVAFNCLLFASITLTQVSASLDSPLNFGPWLAIGVGLIGIACVVILVFRLHVVRRYLAAHPASAQPLPL
jgi:hypothetical protein